MIGPYGLAIESYVARLAAVGYLKSSDTDYELGFSNGMHSISFATERYYHPSVVVTLTDRKGEKFSLGLVREILEPEQFAKELEDLRAIRSRFHLDDKTSDQDTRAAGIEAYMSLIMENVCTFLSAHRDELFTEDGTFLKQYQELQRARLKLLGL
jgi:hypothetical protein